MRIPLMVLIVSYNTRDLLAECLDSALSSPVPIEITVVDNNSSDGSAEMVRKNFPAVRVVARQDNAGFAGGVNDGLRRRAAGQDVLLLNPDATLSAGCLEQLAATLDATPEVGIVAPLVVHPHGRLRVISAGNQPTTWRLFTQFTGLSRLSRRAKVLEGMNLLHGLHDDALREVEWVSGACMLVRGAVFDELGPLSRRWFMYAEDLEFCGRAGLAGWRIVHDPAARARHHLGASSDQDGAVSTMWIESTEDYYRQRFQPSLLQWWLWHAILAGGMASRAAFYGVRSWTDAERAPLWRGTARKFSAYAGAAARGVAH